MDTYDRIAQLMIQHGERAADLAKATGISTGLLSQWKARMQRPSLEKLTLVAEHYGVTVDALQGKAAPQPDITFDDFTYALHNETQELTEENKQKLLEMARFFKAQQKKQADQ
ncbi:MAG: helix-turn-helix transcriptional regulator [Faecalibacterium sp.]|nr:helix-turn-helix transcriptional regulator [Faecalibacterium sp.]